MPSRIAEIKRHTNETKIDCIVDLEKKPSSDIEIEYPFLSHMIKLFEQFADINLKVRAKGDIDIDIHHLNEDLGIVLGQALGKALGDRLGIRRIGHSYVPMDEALVRVVMDICGRPYLDFNCFVLKLENMDSRYSLEYLKQFLTAFSNHLGATVHIDILRGKDFHHVVEATFKALGIAFSLCSEIVSSSFPSTKGVLD